MGWMSERISLRPVAGVFFFLTFPLIEHVTQPLCILLILNVLLVLARHTPEVNFGRFLADLRSTLIWWRSAKSSRATRERKIENRVARSVAREMSIGPNYEGNITPFSSDISRFSRGTGPSSMTREQQIAEPRDPPKTSENIYVVRATGRPGSRRRPRRVTGSPP